MPRIQRLTRTGAWLGALALVLVPVVLIGGPAQAFAPSPTQPPKLTLPGSVISGAAGGNGAAGAQLAGQLAAGKGSPAFPAGSLSKTVGSATQVVSSFNLGTFIGGAVDSAFGIDRDGTVCSATGTDLGGSALRFLSGAQCDAYDNPPSYTPNSDASSRPSGFLGWPQALNCQANGTGCAAQLTYDPLPQPTGQQTWTTTVTMTPKQNWGGLSFYYMCKNSTTGVLESTFRQSNAGTFTTTAASVAYTVSCLAGYEIYSLHFSTNATNDEKTPDVWTASAKQGGYNYWLNSKAANAPTGVSADPDRWLTCTIKTTAGAVLVATSDTFKESSGSVAPLKCPTMDPTQTAGHMTITLNGGPSVLTLYDQDSTAAYQAAQSAYPLCSNARCELDLLDGTGSCYDGDQERCSSWSTDPDRASKYRCKYGTYDVPLSECLVLANRFDPAKVAAGNANADPNTGADTGKQTSTKPGANVGGSADPATGSDRNDCWPQGWAAFNPLNWVLQPIQCAFSPRASKVAELEASVQDKWNKSAFGKVVATVALWQTQLPSVGGCQGPHVAFSIGFWHGSGLPIVSGLPPVEYDGYPLSACAPPYDWLATTARLFADAVMIWAAAKAVVRLISSIVGAKGIN